MTVERFKEIMAEDSAVSWEGDNAIQGLNIIVKYLPFGTILCGADHDIIYSVNADQLVEKGITEKDAKELRRINWMIQDDFLACYV